MKSLSVKYLYNTLDEWIFINIDSDIYECKKQRLEYIHLVEEAEKHGLQGKEISNFVLFKLDHELKLKWYKRPTFWHLVRLNLKRILRII